MPPPNAADIPAITHSNHSRHDHERHMRRHADSDYSSDDEELEDGDLDILNTAQSDISFYPAQPRPNPRYHPTIPPSLQQSRDPTLNTFPNAEIYENQRYDSIDDSSARSRTTSLQNGIHHGSRDYRLPQHNAQAYQDYRKRRPLVDLIRNEWQNNAYSTSHSSSPSHDYLDPKLVQILSAPRFRRYIYILIGFLCLIWVNWHFWAGPSYNEHRLLGKSLRERVKTGGGWFGVNLRPEFLDMVHIKTLDPKLIPQKDNERRLIVVGDVHGCHDELVNLLSEVQYEARTDHLIFAGDFIAKGPSSTAIVELAMSARASCVRGNHEDRILLAYRDMFAHRMTPEQISSKKSSSKKPPQPPQPGMPENMTQNELSEDMVIEGSFAHGDTEDRKQAASFSRKQYDYMMACPVILDIGQVKGMGDVRVVHAGLVPATSLERQDPMGVMHMRTIDLETHVPSGSSKGSPWFKLWNKYQTMIPASQRSTTIYGHDSRRGLQLHEYSKGLDTGCVGGGKLTALIIDNKVTGGEAKTVSVQCRDYTSVGKKESTSKKSR